MGPRNTRNLEKKILEYTEELIECAIAVSLLTDGAKERELKRGTDLVCEIAANLKELIDVKEEYLPEILNQLVSQKLPDREIQTGLGTFGQELEHLLKLGVMALGQRPLDDYEPSHSQEASVSTIESLETPYEVAAVPAMSAVSNREWQGANKVTKSNPMPALELEPETQDVYTPFAEPVKEKPCRGLELSLKVLFPGEQLLKVVSMDGLEFDYYLPGKNLVCDNYSTESTVQQKQKICAGKGLFYVAIDAKDSINPRRVQRLIKWSGNMNTSH